LALISGLSCIQAADKVFTVDIKSVEHPQLKINYAQFLETAQSKSKNVNYRKLITGIHAKFNKMYI
jgi:hypothetical protein